ncbi:MAG: translocation/assembly module TamB domain-containing protein [Pseudomonadota bacterium]
MGWLMVWAKRLGLWLVGLLLALMVLAGIAMLALNTAPGRDYVREQVEALEFENGLKIGVGSIDGSLYSVMILSDLTLSDPQGVFASAPRVGVNWNPFAFAWRHIEIDGVGIETATLSRVPEFNETPPSDEPLLPDYTIDIGAFEIERLVVEAPVAGSERIAKATGKVFIIDRRADVSLTANSVATGLDAAAGDVIELILAAVPEEDRLDVDLDVSAPSDGVIAALAGLPGSLDAELKGEGTWASWDGRLIAQWMDEPLTQLNLTARDGVFGAKGEAQLAEVAPDAVKGLLSGVTVIDVEADSNTPATGIKARLSGEAFLVTAKGAVAVKANRFDDLRAQIEISNAGDLYQGLSGSNARADLLIDGDLTRPSVQYDLTAARLTYAEIGLVGFSTFGRTRVDLDQMEFPIDARAVRVTGLDQAAGGPLTDVRLTGDVLVAWPRIVSDNLRLRSPRLDARLTLVADAQAGRYGGAIDGRIGDYRVESVGLFDGASGADLAISTREGVALEGQVQARSTLLTNESVASFLGGDLVASSDVAYGRDGVTRLSNMRLTSPLVEVSEGAGTYNAQGEFDISAKGVSNTYGPLGVQVVGTVTNPVAKIDAPNPGLGVGLVNVQAEVRGENQTYRIEARGESDFGPVATLMNADLTGVTTRLDIERAEIGGIALSGQLVQSEAGPYRGDLIAAGEGVDGSVQLLDQGGVQIARANLRARDLILPGAARARIGRGFVDADIALYDQPRITAEVQLAKARYFGTQIDTLRADIDLENGSGSAKVLASGRNQVPFKIAANADLQPNLWRAAIEGDARKVTFRTEAPARIIPPFADGSQDPDYRLEPTKLVFTRGSMRVSGRFGTGLELKTRVDELDLVILNAFVTGLGVGGRATGRIDFAQASAGAMPDADAQIEIKNFSRSTALTVSRPVNVSLAGQMRDNGAVGRAVIRQGGEVIGRIHTNLTPTGPRQADWVARLLDAPLGGGLRYTGSAATVFTLAGLPDQRLSGALGIAADFSGRLREPSLNGVLRARDLTYENETYGTQLTGLNARGRFDGNQLLLERLEASAGDGRVTAKGVISLAADQGFPMDIAINLDEAQLARSDALGARATGNLTITKQAGQRGLLAGTLTLPETRYVLRYLEAAEVPELSGVRFKNAGEATPEASVVVANEPGFQDLRLDLKLVADDELYVSGMGLQSEWSANLRVTGTSADPRLAGEIDLVRGTLGFAGREFDIERGRIRFTGSSTPDPRIAITATETIQNVAVSVNVGGSAFTPEFQFTSSPGLPQDEILARILFGSSIANLSALEAVQLAQSLNALSGSGGGLNPLGALRSATGIDRLRVLGADEATGQGTALAAGQYISDDIYVEVITDARGFTATQLEISLTQTLSVLSQAGGVGGTNVNLRYRKDY